jgi:ATP-dependent helicase YprA (DUF1998 family)
MDGSVGNVGPSDSSGFNAGNVKYNSIFGQALCKSILAKYLPYDPHNYQLDAICPAMDGYDLLATTPTGSGKTGYLTMFMLVVRNIATNKTLALGQEKIPKDPAMIIVCPTNALEDDMVWISLHRTVKKLAEFRCRLFRCGMQA